MSFQWNHRVGAVIVEAGVNLCHIVALAARCNSNVGERFDIVRVSSVILHHAETDFGRRHGLTFTLDQTVTDNEEKLVAVRVVGHSNGVHSGSHSFGSFGVSSNQADCVCEREAKRLPVRRRLRHDRLVNEAMWSDTIGFTMHATEALRLSSRGHQAGPVVTDTSTARAVNSRNSTLGAVRASVCVGADV